MTQMDKHYQPNGIKNAGQSKNNGRIVFDTEQENKSYPVVNNNDDYETSKHCSSETTIKCKLHALFPGTVVEWHRKRGSYRGRAANHRPLSLPLNPTAESTDCLPPPFKILMTRRYESLIGRTPLVTSTCLLQSLSNPEFRDFPELS
jgi:hypothetical protein